MEGRGILLGGVPGVAPANVVILGGGIVGSNSARIAAGMGANVFLLDINLERLRYLDDVMPANVTTIYSNRLNIARLLPDAYRDDPDAAGEFRRFTEQSLRTAKQDSARTVLDTLPSGGGPVKLSGEQAQSWLRALNDVRLALGVRLGVTEEFEEQWQELDPLDPRSAAFEVYAWLGGVQESLVQALM